MNMKNMKAAAGAQTQELEMTITRLLAVPQKLAFSAWTEPQHLKRWENAPKGFTVSTHEVDFRVGGAYRICMRSPEGVDHWLQGEYREIVKPERLVMTHTWLDAQGKPGKETLLTITFSDLGGKTRFTLHQTGFSSAGSREGHRDGWNSSIDRFTEYLRTL
ncbi:MAG TPA: SRPBCC domain-containing protein [Candidatus Sulfotelmatobacter sp.]|nr:SRPBCC domain-containing protein [Candidatus Sulfotelmatobacter sp.]